MRSSRIAQLLIPPQLARAVTTVEAQRSHSKIPETDYHKMSPYMHFTERFGLMDATLYHFKNGWGNVRFGDAPVGWNLYLKTPQDGRYEKSNDYTINLYFEENSKGDKRAFYYWGMSECYLSYDLRYLSHDHFAKNKECLDPALRGLVFHNASERGHDFTHFLTAKQKVSRNRTALLLGVAGMAALFFMPSKENDDSSEPKVSHTVEHDHSCRNQKRPS